MISRCPSCGAQVPDDAKKCGACHWDFKALRRMPPTESPFAAASKPETPAEAKEEPADSPRVGPGSVTKEAPAFGSAGLVQFPKLDPASKSPRSDEDPFAVRRTPAPAKLPSFGKESAPVEPREPAPDIKLSLPSSKAAQPKEAPKEGEEKPADKLSLPTPKSAFSPTAKTPSPAPPVKPSEPKPVPGAAPQVPAPMRSETEPPKTVIRRRVPEGEDKPTAGKEGDSKPPRTLERGTKPAAAPQPAAAAPADGGGSGFWKGAVIGLIVAAAGGGLFFAGRATSRQPAVPVGGAFVPVTPATPVPAPIAAPPDSAPDAAVAAVAPAGAAPSAPVSAVAVAAPTQPAAPAVAAPVAPPPGTMAPTGRSSVVLLSKPTLPPAAADAVVKAAAKPQWVFRGRVYDLINLNAVSGARLTFNGPDGKAAGEVVTAPDGGFEITLDALNSGGYQLVLKHAELSGRWLDEVSPPYEQAPVEDRKAASRGRSSKPWVGAAGRPTHRVVVAVPIVIEE